MPLCVPDVVGCFMPSIAAESMPDIWPEAVDDALAGGDGAIPGMEP